MGSAKRLGLGLGFGFGKAKFETPVTSLLGLHLILKNAQAIAGSEHVLGIVPMTFSKKLPLGF